MFVPIHARRAATAGGRARVKVKPAVVMAVATAVAAGIASDVLHAGASARSDSGWVVLGVVIGIGAAALGLALARAIGRQVKA